MRLDDFIRSRVIDPRIPADKRVPQHRVSRVLLTSCRQIGPGVGCMTSFDLDGQMIFGRRVLFSRQRGAWHALQIHG